MDPDNMLENKVTDLTIKTVTEIEQLAEEILTDRAQIIDYDKKRNSNRESLRALKNSSEKQWLCFGNLFLKLSHDHSVKLIHEDQKKLEDELKNIHDGLKPKIKKLHKLEGLPDVKGFELNSMD